MTELAVLVDELLDPLFGIERGLMNSDGGDRLIGVHIAEIRKIGTCLRLVRTELLSDESKRDAGAANNRPATNK